MALPNGNGQDIVSQMRSQIGAAHAKIDKLAAAARQLGGNAALQRQELTNVNTKLAELASILSSVSVSGGAPSPKEDNQVISEGQLVYINQIPGRRIPFDLLCTIPIGKDVTNAQQQLVDISQDGPFVATARAAIFQSAHTFSRTVSGVVTTWNGRTNGRYRPPHSGWDLSDATAFQPVVGVANPGNGSPIFASPSNHSGFRSMEFDGVIEMIAQGSGYFRHNNPVPSCFWTDQINSAFQLGALDFFERGSAIEFKATPNHINNPQAGNVSGFTAGGVYPAIDSQYDVHEGILDEYDSEETSDPVTRNPDGFLILLLHGFRILQPPGPVRMV